MDVDELKKQIKTFGLESLGVYYGSYRGFIFDNKDPEKLGRVQLTVPQIFGKSENGDDEPLDYWAWSKGIFAGKNIGKYAIPNIGDMVWVSFEGGNPRYPIWEYGHFAKPGGVSDVPPEWEIDQDDPPVIMQTAAGHKVEFINKKGSELVRVTNKQGYLVELNKNGISLVVPTGKKINLGSLDNAAEPALLGDKTETALNNIVTLLQSIAQNLAVIGTTDTTVASTIGLTYATTFTALSTQMLLDIMQINLNIAQIKSQKITLD